MSHKLTKPQREKLANFREGFWFWPINANKAHFYGEDRRSACGKWAVIFVPDNAGDGDINSPTSPDDCKGCRTQVNKMLEWTES